MTAASATEPALCAARTTPNTRIRRAFDAFLRHRSIFAATAGLVLFTAFVVTISIAPVYKSEATVLVRNPPPDAIASLTTILRSREVAESLVDPEWSKTPAAQHSGAEIRRHERTLTAFGRNLEIVSAAQAGSLHVAFVASSADEAADLLGQLLEEAASRLKLAEPAPRPVSFVPQPAALPAPAGPAAAEALRSRIDGVDAARRAAQTQLAETAERVAAQKHDLAILSPWILGDVNPAYRQGKEKLAAGIAQLGALRGRISTLTSQREHLARQLSDLKDAPAASLQKVAAPVSVTPPPPAERVVVTENPTLPARPIRPRPLLNLVLGIAAALLFGLGAVVVAELRSRAPLPRKLEEIAAMPLLATIPHAPPRAQRTFGALALSPVFRERDELEPSLGLLSLAPAQLPLATPTPRLVLEPLEPAPRLPARGLGNQPLPARSRLTPSQRAQLRRSAPAPDPEGRGYVTYTFDPRQ